MTSTAEWQREWRAKGGPSEASRRAAVERVRRWRKTNAEQHRAGHRRRQAKRRALKNGATVEDVDPQLVFEKGEGVCGICNKPVSKAEFQVDHTIPLSKGGEHSYANTQPAHPKCNAGKAAW